MSLSSLLTGRRYREAIAPPMGDNVSGVTTPKRRAPAEAARSMAPLYGLRARGQFAWRMAAIPSAIRIFPKSAGL
jgi:hypothetical protein